MSVAHNCTVYPPEWRHTPIRIGDITLGMLDRGEGMYEAVIRNLLHRNMRNFLHGEKVPAVTHSNTTQLENSRCMCSLGLAEGFSRKVELQEHRDGQT